MKKILTLLLAMSLLASCVFSLSSCEISGMFDGQKPSETPAPTDPAPTDPAPTESEIEEPKASVYAGYQLINLEDKVTIELLENVFTDEANYFSYSVSSSPTVSYYENALLSQNQYLLEVLEKENAGDLLLWGFEHHIHRVYNKELGDLGYTEEGVLNYKISLAFALTIMKTDSVRAKMSDKQNAAADQLHYYAEYFEEIKSGEPVYVWSCDACDLYITSVVGNGDTHPDSCRQCNDSGDFKIVTTFNVE